MCGSVELTFITIGFAFGVCMQFTNAFKSVRHRTYELNTFYNIVLLY